MPDEQQAADSGATPVAITLSAHDELLPKLAFAAYDGSAAGAYQPVIRFVGPSGVIAAQALGDPVAAGGSVDQTWFRGLAKTGSSSAASTGREIIQSNAPTNIVGGARDYLDWDHLHGASLLDLTVPKVPLIKTKGVYAFTVTVTVDPMAVGAQYQVQIGQYFVLDTFTDETSAPATAAEPQPLVSCTLTLELAANAAIFANVLNQGAVAQNFQQYPTVVQKVS